jgi:CHAT domain-containing protein
MDMTKLGFTPLPSTADEVRAIAAELPGASVLLAAQATESAVKAARPPRILHIATHGFFLPDQPEPPPAGRAANASSEPTPKQVAAALQRENPLLRAGLALAGANARASGLKEDGILTALEASGLDLYGTRLVVLSACETGLGDAVYGDGVYGLRRALVIAGAETQVMSLWQVDTGRTRELMVGYYEKLLAGAGRGEALRRTQLEMLASEETSHPNLWAAFIVSGDWRTLEGGPAVPDFARVAPGPRGCACMHAGADKEREDGAALGVLAIAALLTGRLRHRAATATP